MMMRHNVNNEELSSMMLLTGEMSHDHSKNGFKTKSLTGILSDATQNWEVPKPKMGLTSINKKIMKIWWLVLHDAAEELSLIVDRLRTR